MSKGFRTALVVVGVIVIFASMIFSLKRQYDLVSSLVEAIKEYASDEKDLFEDITFAQNRVFRAGQAKGYEDITSAQHRVFWAERAKGPESEVVPTILHSRVDDAVEMRFGNTRQEAAIADWMPYVESHWWLVRGEATGDGTGASYKMSLKRVWAEYKLADGTITKMSAIQPARDEDALAREILFPRLKMGDFRATDYITYSKFEDWNEYWTSYNDWRYYGNVFWPWSWSAVGGVDNTPHIWSDDSRWNIDAPESPNSVLVGLVYWKWLIQRRIVSSRSDSKNLKDVEVGVSLRGTNLNLKGANVYIWVENDDGRWHCTDSPLKVGGSLMEDNAVTLSMSRTWTRTYDRHGKDPSLDLAKITSFGISFVGFPRGDMPTGILRMDNFYIKRL